MDDGGVTKACGCPLLPLKSHIKGPAPDLDQGSTYILNLFVNCLTERMVPDCLIVLNREIFCRSNRHC